ncbi:hypothetical protein HBI57_100020 [Parastagonospora nodorum]|nr:hypothetical protein HBI57_100020 [Parastagonospora nodorum]KAH6482049.1 hypothetical protein HBI58_072390 [Parastagonospora nodorum]
MATLAAHDQENAIRNISIGPGGKPLNAGAKGLGAKTPGNKAPKTPFKIPLNDENVIKPTGKANGKGNENAFLTPAGPRTRAPLGMKTTNAKSNAFKTPAPLGSSAKTQKLSPRLRRPKVKVHQTEPEAEDEDDVPEVEYMPPKEIPLADDMDDYLPKDWNFPKLDKASINRGIWQAFSNPIEDDGRPKKLREFEEGLERSKKKRDEDFDKLFAAEQAKEDAEARRYMGVDVPKKTARKPMSTMRARSAAQALSPASTKPNFAKPTAAVKSRLPTGFVASKKAKPPVEPTPARRAAAVAASHSTIGYAQGRAAPAGRKPLSNVTKPAPFSAASRAASTRPTGTMARSRSAFSRSSSAATDATLVTPPGEEDEEVEPYRTAADVERELELMLLARDEEEDEDEDRWLNSFNSQLAGDPVDEELEDFQLRLPEGF